MWIDPAFKTRLIKNDNGLVCELGLDAGDAKRLVVENTSEAHNVIVCTLCSC